MNPGPPCIYSKKYIICLLLFGKLDIFRRFNLRLWWTPILFIYMLWKPPLVVRICFVVFSVRIFFATHFNHFITTKLFFGILLVKIASKLSAAKHSCYNLENEIELRSSGTKKTTFKFIFFWRDEHADVFHHFVTSYCLRRQKKSIGSL